jgi:hypothetical protein
VFAYKVIRDYGFAPNPFHNFCTLATCKPHIRDRANIGDLVIGAGSARRLGDRAIFAMRVTDSLSFDQYWNDPRFFKKRPSFFQSEAMAYGDNIYHHEPGGAWIQEDSHHSFEGGVLNHDNLVRDTSVDQVLISDDFVYWGGLGPVLPTEILDHGLPRDYRSSYAEDEVEAIDEWFRQLPRGLLSRPADW